MSRNEEFEDAHYSSRLFDEVNDREWHHGTTVRGDRSIRSKGARATFTDNPQTQGPGFYVFGDHESAIDHALDITDGTHDDPAVQSGHVGPTFPMSVTHRHLERLGRQFREANPRVSTYLHDAALGNIALRQKGVDFLHVTENHHGDPADYGVILSPGVWVPRRTTHPERTE